MTDSEHSSAPNVGSLWEDTPCLACGYNLRGLRVSGNCPECGFIIKKTLIARHGMTKRDLAILSFRVIAVWMVIGEIADTAPSYFFFQIDSLMDALRLLIWLHVLVLLGVLWWKAPWLARKAVPHDGPITIGAMWRDKDVMTLTISVIGVVLMTWGVAGFGWSLAAWLAESIVNFALSNLVGSSISFTIGVVLLLRARNFVRLILWLRTVGTKRDERQA